MSILDDTPAEKAARPFYDVAGDLTRVASLLRLLDDLPTDCQRPVVALAKRRALDSIVVAQRAVDALADLA